MTTYIILRATNEAATIFAIDGEQDASSPERAVRLWMKTVAEGELLLVYAAVPKRSWRPLKVEVEVRETVKVKPL